MQDVLLNIVVEIWSLLKEMSPYLLFGFFIAGILSIFLSPSFVERQLSGRGIVPVVKASLFGIPLPLCSCGVIPVTASLRKSGASRAAAASFLVSTPQTGVDSILVTYSMLGPVFAVIRPVVALFAGIFTGTLVSFAESESDVCSKPHHTENKEIKEKGILSKFLSALDYGFFVLSKDIAVPLAVGIVVAGLLSALVPDAFFENLLGRGLAPKLAMAAAGMPMYVCATASVPVAAALLVKGITPGAVLVFLMTGPATNAASFSTIWKVLGRKTAVIYIFSVFATALAAGTLLDAAVYGWNFDLNIRPPAMVPDYIGIPSAVVLAVLIVYALVSHGKENTSVGAEGRGDAISLRISGMTCEHCAMSVKNAIAGCSGVESVEVLLSTNTAVIRGNPDMNSVVRAVEDSGYTAEISSADHEMSKISKIREDKKCH